MTPLLTRLLPFAGASGAGLTLDVVLYTVLKLGGLPTGLANGVSATCAVTLVYFLSLRHVFSAADRQREPRLLATYVVYQAAAIPAASVLVAACSHALGDRWLLAKALVLPVTFLVNFGFMSWLLRPTLEPLDHG